VLNDLDLAASLVRGAGLQAAAMRRVGLSTTRKTSVSDLVSDADHAAEQLIVDRLRDARPDDGIVGEEGTSFAGTRTWFVDPVDGTYNFVSGLPFWCSAVALVDEQGPLLAAVYHVESDELWLGGRDTPTTCNGVSVHVTDGRPLAELSLASYLHPATLPDDGVRLPLLRVLRAAATVRMLGSGSVELAFLAGGRLGGWVHYDAPDWDWLPGAALVLGAGGATHVTEVGAHRWHIAGSRHVVDEITALLENR
jgi:myo-inositol-1(or 4)-monophosphatase